jgi:reactive intermediate/imine deaminase
MKQSITSIRAPAPIGTYSQAIKAGSFVFLSGQIALEPGKPDIISGDFKVRVRQIFKNIQALAIEAGGNLAQIVKLTVYLTDMQQFVAVNEVMAEFFVAPYPARTMVTVAALPKGTDVEIDATMIVGE